MSDNTINRPSDPTADEIYECLLRFGPVIDVTPDDLDPRLVVISTFVTAPGRTPQWPTAEYIGDAESVLKAQLRALVAELTRALGPIDGDDIMRFLGEPEWRTLLEERRLWTELHRVCVAAWLINRAFDVLSGPKVRW